MSSREGLSARQSPAHIVMEGQARSGGAQKGGLSVLGILIDAIDYDEAVHRIVSACEEKRPFAVSALAVHGVMTGVLDEQHAYRLNHLDLLVPDGQPVRWMLNLRHHAGLVDRCYGPELVLRVCAEAAVRGLVIGVIGSTSEVQRRFRNNLTSRFPGLTFVFSRPSAFRQLTEDEVDALAKEVAKSGAQLVFVGLGCPRQEVFVFENRERMGVPLLAVGAAFDFHAGTLRQAPARLQRLGLEWAFRFCMEPKRLWKRYLTLNPLFSVLGILQLLRVPILNRVRGGTLPREQQRFG